MSRYAWVGVVVLFGCQQEQPAPRVLDGAGTCGPSTCGGCCQGELCVNDVSSSACGSAGFPCVQCDPGETCTNGQCGGSSSCNLATCAQGCCKNNQCMPGDINTACGSSGALCMDCVASGGTCQGQTCQGGQPCSPQICSGCCQANQCFGGGEAARCGVSGASCVDCAASGKSCDPQTGNCVTGPPPSCSPASCGSGCCQGNQCLPGNTNVACGTGGNGCADCTTLGKSCDVASRLCAGPPPSCGPGSCSGCCKNNQCLSGSGDAACGLGGVPCVDCAAVSKTCDAASGSCKTTQPGCGPGSCPGCCKGTQCQGGTNDWACGLGGVLCADCSANGGTCTSGSCSAPPACGPGNCTGCCDGNNCVAGTSKYNCGTGGGICTTCGAPYESCSVGACVVDPASKWEVEVIRATINQAKVWDSWLVGDSKLPDPYFGIDWDTCSSWSIDSPCSDTESNTYDPEWYASMGIFTASKIKGGWCAFVGEADGVASCSPPFETIGLCSVKIYDNNLKSGSAKFGSCPNPDGNNYVTNLELKFTYTP